MSLSELPGRVFFRIAFPLYYKRKLQKTSHIRLFGFSLTVPPGVFHPGLFFSTKIMGRYLSTLDLRGKAILEMGCGSGLLSLIAASKGGVVTGVDISPSAIACTRANADANGLGQKIHVIESNLFAAVPEEARFDLILWNPPFFPREPQGKASMAWNAGTGYHIIREFADAVGSYLAPGGRILLILTNKGSDREEILSFFGNGGFQSDAVLTRRTVFEVFTIVELKIR